LQGIPGVVVYLDDILVTGVNQDSHLKTLDDVLSRLKEAGLRLKRGKCVFLADEVEYLGHRVDAQGFSLGAFESFQMSLNIPSFIRLSLHHVSISKFTSLSSICNSTVRGFTFLNASVFTHANVNVSSDLSLSLFSLTLNARCGHTPFPLLPVIV